MKRVTRRRSRRSRAGSRSLGKRQWRVRRRGFAWGGDEGGEVELELGIEENIEERKVVGEGRGITLLVLISRSIYR